MESPNPSPEIFKEIYTNRHFHRLKPYRSSARWTKLSVEEKQLLANLFVMEGEDLLKIGDFDQALQTFDLANRVTPNHPDILLKQVSAYIKHHENIGCLKLALQLLEKIVHLEPENIEALWTWGNTLTKIGIISDDPKYFEEAEIKYAKSIIAAKKNIYKNLAHIYWNWGICCHHLSRHSGEPIELKAAIEKYQKAAAETGMQSAKFWIDYGSAIVDFSELIGNESILIDAVEKFSKAQSLEPENIEAFLRAGNVLRWLYESTRQNTYAKLARASFSTASSINPRHANLWMQWGQLDCSLGHDENDMELMHEGIQKIIQALEIEPENPKILNELAAAKMLCFSFDENLSLLKEAEALIAKSMRLTADDVQTWYLYGRCLGELGEYFEEKEFFLKAIEKYEMGLRFDSKNSLLLSGLASAYFALGELVNNLSYLDKAQKNFSKASNSRLSHTPAFFLEWGECLMKAAEFSRKNHYVESALEKFTKAIALLGKNPTPNQNNIKYYYSYACALDYYGDLIQKVKYIEHAVELFLHLLSIDPDYYSLHFALGVAYLHIGEIKEDVDSFKKSIDLFELFLEAIIEDEWAFHDVGLASLNLAVLIGEDDDSQCFFYFQKAEQRLMQAVQLGNTPSLYHLACLYSLTGQFDFAMQYLELSKEKEILPSPEQLLEDYWLEDVRETHAFQQFFQQLIYQQKKNSI